MPFSLSDLAVVMVLTHCASGWTLGSWGVRSEFSKGWWTGVIIAFTVLQLTTLYVLIPPELRWDQEQICPEASRAYLAQILGTTFGLTTAIWGGMWAGRSIPAKTAK